MKSFILSLFLFGLIACGTPQPPNEPDCCLEEPVEPPIEPPPIDPVEPEPPKADPTNYVHINRVPALVDPKTGIITAEMTFAGWRDLLYMASYCANSTGFLGMSSTEMTDFGNVGADLTREGEDILVPKLQVENRRCSVNNVNFDPAFLKANGECARSEVRKVVLKDYTTRSEEHLDVAIALRNKSQTCRVKLVQAGGRQYDSIKGFCQSLIKAEVSNASVFCR